MIRDTDTLRDSLVFFLGVNTGFTTNGLPDSRFIDFYQQRSSPKLHCAIVGNVVVPGGFGSNDSTPMLDSDPSWKRVANAIDSKGSKPGIQLASAWSGYLGQRKFVARKPSEFIEHARQLVLSLELEVVDSILNAFHEGASLAVDHGFRHVQIHAAHGYLLSLLVDSRINSNAYRTRDKLADLAQFLGSQDIETSIRCSIRTGDDEFDKAGNDENIRGIVELPYDFVDLSSGYYNIDKRLIYPSRPEIVSSRHKESRAIASRYPTRKFIVSGKVMRKGIYLPENVDIGICRDLIANPDFLSDQQNGCRDHGKCHYHSRNEKHLTCGRWLPQ
ncbi:hypothetical protein AB9F26_09545 [Falsihalocynthiibacter sp. BN13B15]|uniref:oxidoreductase n=1 Tax=Falsihalocynthiibacter sp. BN13B15 TaxID=3240871 RepID=UPI003510A3FC